MPIETVFLDAGGVLVFPNWTRVSAALAGHGVSADPRALAAAEPHVKRDIDDGRVVATTGNDQRGWLYFDWIFERAGIRPSDATAAAVRELYEYHQKSNLWELVPDGTEAALAKLRALGLRLVVVSNANGQVRNLFDRLGLSKYFDCLIDSFVEGVEKPDPRLFRIALDRSGAQAASTLHVGDLYHVDVIGARAAGLQAVLLDAAGLYPDVDCPRVRSLGELVELCTRATKSG